MYKQIKLVMALLKLHNYCLKSKFKETRNIPKIMISDEINLSGNGIVDMVRNELFGYKTPKNLLTLNFEFLNAI